MTLMAGFAGGLAGTLWSGIVSSSLYARWPVLRPQPWLPETATRLLTAAALYATCGMAAGFLFWLSWGLVAIVAMPWPVVGAFFGTLVWLAGGLPSLGAFALRAPRARGAVAVLALEGLVASIAAGLLCAYVWRHSG